MVGWNYYDRQAPGSCPFSKSKECTVIWVLESKPVSLCTQSRRGGTKITVCLLGAKGGQDCHAAFKFPVTVFPPVLLATE